MVVTFFDNHGVVYQHYLPMKTSVTAAVFQDVMGKFLRVFARKRPEMAKNQWYLHMDNAPCHSAKATKEFLAKKDIKTIDHPAYSPDLAPADFFYFPTLKRALEGTSVGGKTVRTEWERVGRTLSSAAFTAAFKKWVERWEKCIRLAGDHVEKIT